MKNKKIIIAFVVVIIVTLILIFMDKKEQKVPVLNEYPNKVVYTTDLSAETEPLIGDCQARGGEFNSCGSPCSQDDEFCTAVCAYTCDLE